MKTQTAVLYKTERSVFRCLAERKRSGIKYPRTRERRNCAKTDTRKSSPASILIPLITIYLLKCGMLPAESLWSPDFKGYMLDGTVIAEGDVVTVQIDSDMSLSFSASSNDSKGLTLEFSGGEFGDIFSFLPDISTAGNRSVKGSEEHTFKSSIVTRVAGADENGHIFVQGNRVLTFEGKEEAITLSGWIDPRDLSRDRVIHFSKIADSRLVFTSFLQPAAGTLSPEDIEEIIAAGTEVGLTPAEEAVELENETPAEETPLAGEASNGLAPEGVAPAPVADEKVDYTLNSAKKKELFLRYINRLIDLLFE